MTLLLTCHARSASAHFTRLVARRFARFALCASLILVAAAIAPTAQMHAQTAVAQSAATLGGTVFDPHGVALANAAVTLRNEAAKVVLKQTSDAQGKYAFANLAAGKYALQVEASGFAASRLTSIQVASGQAVDLPITLAMGGVSDQVTVEAGEANSVAAALAPMDALLAETSPRTEITQAFIANYTSPTADYGEVVQMAPGTVTLNGNGVGLGQSKTYFRGFPDGDYDIDFDGLPFYDTNSPTHHSWAFFPSQWLGGVDFDRSPGTASTVGPTPFGGSIHLLSRELSPIQNIRGGVSYGSWGTLLVDGQYDSGALGANRKVSLFLDVHHMDSKGYQSNNFQNRNAGSIKAQYKFSDDTVLTGFSGVVYLHANTPGFNSTRCQMYGQPTDGSYSCYVSGTSGPLLPYTGAGKRFYLADNTDPVDYLDYQYNRYQVPTDFEYVSFKTKLPLGIKVEIKPYTYNYDNGELYSNSVPITEGTTVNYNGNAASTTWYGIKVQPCNVMVKGVEPCGVDKYNSYRKYGETGTLTQTSKYGVLRAGVWYEWADTNRHQFPSDPLTGWTDQAMSNFNESFWTNSYQPYAEYEFHVTKKLNITAGTKFAYYDIKTKQYADNGSTIGNLGTSKTVGLGDPTAFITNSGSYFATLPSLDANYRLKSNWSVYGQLATGSIVPPSNVFDYTQGTPGSPISVETLPKQQRSTTYQAGTVLKLRRVTFDADYYHIKFQNSYSSVTDPSTGESVWYPQPGSISKGFEAQSNLYLGHGFSGYLNSTVSRATYTGGITIYPTAQKSNSTANPLWVNTPSGLWVQQTPSDTEAEGLMYQNKGLDAGFLNKRVGTMYIDSGSYHNQITINPFSVSNIFVNYTVRKGSIFDQTKIRLSINNLFNQSNITSVSAGTKATKLPTGTQGAIQPLAGNTTYTDPFYTVGGSSPVLGGDTIGALPGRSIVLSVTFGLTPKH